MNDDNDKALSLCLKGNNRMVAVHGAALIGSVLTEAADLDGCEDRRQYDVA